MDMWHAYKGSLTNPQKCVHRAHKLDPTSLILILENKKRATKVLEYRRDCQRTGMQMFPTQTLNS